MFHKFLLMLTFIGIAIGVTATSFASSAPVATSPDGDHTAAVIVHENGTKSVLLDGRDLGVFDVNGDSYFQFDNDNHLIFTATQGEKKIYVVDGKADSFSCDGPMDMIYTPGSSYIKGFSCLKGGSYFIRIVGGTTYGPFYSSPSIAYSYFANDYPVQAYSVCESSDKCYFILADGTVVGKEYESANNLNFYGKKNEKLAYSYQKKGKWYVSLGGKSTKVGADSVYQLSVVDSDTVFAVVQKGNTYSIYRNGKLLKAGITMPNVFNYYANPDGITSTAYTTFVIGDQGYVWIGGKTYGPYQNFTGYVSFNEDYSIWTAFAKKDGKSGIIVNGKFITP